MIPIQPRIKVELDDGTGTWITHVPIHQLDSTGALLAAGEAFAFFIANLERNPEHVTLHLKATERA